jgi:hypothetical protein
MPRSAEKSQQVMGELLCGHKYAGAKMFRRRELFRNINV